MKKLEKKSQRQLGFGKKNLSETGKVKVRTVRRFLALNRHRNVLLVPLSSKSPSLIRAIHGSIFSPLIFFQVF